MFPIIKTSIQFSFIFEPYFCMFSILLKKNIYKKNIYNNVWISRYNLTDVYFLLFKCRILSSNIAFELNIENKNAKIVFYTYVSNDFLIRHSVILKNGDVI